MNTYLDYGGNIVMPAPASLSGSLMYNFLFESNGGDKSVLQAVLDERLNFATDSSYRYEAMCATMMFTFARTAADRSIPDQRRGFVAEQEVVAWIPCIEQIKKHGSWYNNRMVWHVPYIVVDNIWAAAAGREIYGLPKNMGHFDIPENPHQRSTFKSTISGFQQYGPESQLADLPFLDIKPVSGPAKAHSFAHSREAGKFIASLQHSKGSLLDMLSPGFLLHELEDLLHLRMNWVNLKQFRSIEDSTSACFQSIVEAPIAIKKFHRGGVLEGSFELELHEVASAPIGKELGLSSGQTATAALWLDVDFDAQLGKTIWQAPIH